MTKKKSTMSLTVLAVMFLMTFTTATAQDAMLGEVRIFAGNFAPRGWAKCEGQLLPISQNSALFSLLGTMYGGDGRTTFALPDLRGRVAVSAGRHPGSAHTWRVGQRSGTETNTMTVNNLANHSHSATVTAAGGAGSSTLSVSSGDGDHAEPTMNSSIAKPVDANGDEIMMFNNETPNISIHTASIGNIIGGTPNVAIGNTGGQQPINNIQPIQTVTYIIALQGTFPSRQ